MLAKNRQRKICILNDMVGAFSAGVGVDEVLNSLLYCKSDTLTQHEMFGILQLFNNIVSRISYSWKQFVSTNGLCENMFILICGGKNVEEFKECKDTCVHVRYYADVKLKYKVCCHCAESLMLKDKFNFYSYKQIVSGTELYWFVCCNICECCFSTKLYTILQCKNLNTKD